MSTTETVRLREIADRAQAAAELAMNRIEYPDNYVDQAIRDEAYATGVEDVLRYLAGDAAPTEELALVLRAGRSEEHAEPMTTCEVCGARHVVGEDCPNYGNGPTHERCPGSGLARPTGGEWRCPECSRTVLAEAGIHPSEPRLRPHPAVEIH